MIHLLTQVNYIFKYIFCITYVSVVKSNNWKTFKEINRIIKERQIVISIIDTINI